MGRREVSVGVLALSGFAAAPTRTLEVLRAEVGRASPPLVNQTRGWVGDSARWMSVGSAWWCGVRHGVGVELVGGEEDRLDEVIQLG